MKWSRESSVVSRQWWMVWSLSLGAAAPVAAQARVLVEQKSGTSERLQAVSVVSPQVVWASGTGGTYLRTLDGGATWEKGLVPGADSLEFRDLYAASADTAWLLAAGPGDHSRIYQTRDAGRHWSIQFVSTDPSAFFDCIAFRDARRGYAVSDAVNGEFLMLRTDNGGATWERIPADRFPPAKENEGMFAASGTCLITMGDSLAWLGTGAGKVARVLRTTDAGQTWTAASTPIVQDTPTAGIMSLVFFDRERGLALGGDLSITEGTTDNVAASGDGGATWLLVGRTTFSGAIYGAVSVPGQGLTAVAVGPKGSSVTTDGGRTWSRLNDGNYWSVGFASDGTGWMVGPKGRITRVTLGER